MKRKSLLLLIAVFSVFINDNIILAQTAVPYTNYGVWNRGADPLYNPDMPNYDYLVGVTIGPTWKEIQSNNSEDFDWTIMQEAIDFAFATDQLITLKINVGPQCPDWIYDNVTKVFTDDDKFGEYPDYQDQDYIDAYYALIDSFAAFVYSQEPQEKQDIISFIFPQNGATGDEVGYKGDPLAGSDDLWFATDAQEWKDFRRASWAKWKSVFQEDDNQRDIPFLFNNVPFDEDVNNDPDWLWVIDEIGNDFGIKASNAYARGHHLTNEKEWNDTYTKFLVDPDPQDLQLFNRAEMDQSWRNPVFQINQELGFYWGAIGGLSTGLSVWDITTNALEEARINTSIQESFRFFNKYAGEIDPATSTKAFIVLHEGLDASDIEKFPIGTYGDADRTNTTRYQLICDDQTYESRGARMDDLDAATKGQVDQRSNQTGYNDAGWDIWPTNYSRFIDQVDPDAESIGLFRVGDVIGEIDENSSVYSRFARSFENSSGKDEMYFNMHEDFFSGAAGVLKISVIYFDNNADSTWELKYDAGDGDEDFKTAFVIDDNTGSNTWKTRTIIVDDAVMDGNGTQNSDFALINTDNIDDIFHRIEIEQLDGTDTVSIESPVFGENIILDENPDVVVTAIGFDNQGITEMRFSVDNGAFSADTTEPYSFTFSNLEVGEHTLQVQMVDALGNTLDAEEVTINVIETAPVADFITITSPPDGAFIDSGLPVTIIAEAFDNQEIDNVRFKFTGDNDNYFPEDADPYTFTFNDLEDGEYTFTADVRDVNGIRIFSDPVTVTIGPIPDDFVEITAPETGDSFPDGSDILVTTDYFDIDGISAIRFKLNEADFIDVTEEPYTIEYLDLVQGDYTIQVQMLDDLGQTIDAEPVMITITETIDDFVTITSPMDGDTYEVGESITITADAFDNEDIEFMRFKIGTSDRFFDFADPYSFTFTSEELSALGEGQFTVFVDIRDESPDQNRTFAEEITITISASSCTATTTFTSSGWDNGVPDANTEAIFAIDYDTSLGNITACKIVIQDEVTLTINAEEHILVTDIITVDAGGSLIVAHQGSVVQINDDAAVVNNGAIHVNVTTPVLKPRDFILSGSPMSLETRDGAYDAGYTFRDHSTLNFIPHPDVVDFYAPNEVANFVDDNFNDWSVYDGLVNPAEGYLVRPQANQQDGNTAYDLIFTHGTLNNGVLSYAMDFNADKNSSPNMLSNPYASAIDGELFLNANPEIDELYFWEHITTPSGDFPGGNTANFSMEDISMYNLSGGIGAGTAATNGGTTPNGMIATSQGFGVKASAAGVATFNNAMRVTTGNNTLRTPNSSIDRIWLQIQSVDYDLSSETLIAFSPNATAAFNPGYDSEQIGKTIALYSHLPAGELSLGIQGREAFNESIQVPMGYASQIDEPSVFKISIKEVKGVAIEATQVYLTDLLDNTTINLSEIGDYSFVSDKGNFTNRFILHFDNRAVLGTNDTVVLDVLIAPNPTEGLFTISTGNLLISNVTIADIQGRTIRQLKGNDTNKMALDISDLNSAVYFVAVETENGSQILRLIRK